MSGRPKIIIDDEKLKTVCGYKLPLRDVATLFDCSEDTIERHIRKVHNMRFAEFRDKYLAKTRMLLINKAISMANGGNTAMMIFALKNMCGWADKQEIAAKEGKKFTLAYSVEDKK